MTIEEQYFIRAMAEFGNRFSSALADAWSKADAENRGRLRRAFPELMLQYGPGTAFFNAVEAD